MVKKLLYVIKNKDKYNIFGLQINLVGSVCLVIPMYVMSSIET